MRTILAAILIITGFSSGQNIIPFGSAKNSIEIAVKNSSPVEAGDVIVELLHPPAWLKFQDRTSAIKDLSPGSVSSAHFTFTVEKNAPIGTREILEFSIQSAAGEQWKKEISVQVAAPERFEVFQNFPNPFNPSTTIAYQLPLKSHISIMLYDITGREVRSVYSGIKEPGYYEEQLDLHDLSSGVYLYRISGDTFDEIKKMILIK